MNKICGVFILSCCLACQQPGKTDMSQSSIDTANVKSDTQKLVPVAYAQPGKVTKMISVNEIAQKMPAITGRELVAFAKTLIGTPYKYASAEPSAGFDCSGFITHVFNHFNIDVPRSSADFTNVGKAVDVQGAKEGDLVLFTGTVDSVRVVGHMGIVTGKDGVLTFIHATSGRANGVTISELNDYYKGRFVKVIRVLPD